jgi:hypothetical protein
VEGKKLFDESIPRLEFYISCSFSISAFSKSRNTRKMRGNN